MALQLLLRLPQMMMITLRKEQEKRKMIRRVRQASLMIDKMPEWQKKDLNISMTDFQSYKHRM